MKLVDRIYNTKELVAIFLENEPETRNSDPLLCKRIWFRMNPAVQTHFEDAFTFPEKYNIPAFETVRRTRQYLQAQRPELGPTGRIKEAREDNEVVYEEIFKKH